MRSSIIMKIASRLVDTNVDLHTDFCDSSDIGTEAQFTKESCTVQSYAKEVLSLGLLFLNFKDAGRSRPARETSCCMREQWGCKAHRRSGLCI